MNQQPVQFGEEIKNPLERVSAYGVILDDEKRVLVVEVNGNYHLPGGGIDEGEDEKEAVKRESIEETGYTVSDLEFIGKANQYLPNASLGPMNKLATFYSGTVVSHDPSKRVELDHEPKWVTRDEIKGVSMSDFYKWAVEQVFNKNNSTKQFS